MADPNLLDAVRLLRAAQCLAREAQILIGDDVSLTRKEREQMQYWASQNTTHLGLTAAYAENRMLREAQE